MELNELRIGNYYWWYAEGKNYDLKVRREDFSNDNYKNFMPIPLTEEWLINFGFEKIGQNFRKFEDHGYGLGMTEFVVWFNATKKTYNVKAINILIGIETVHRLQNVYHALAGKELTHQKIN